MVKKISSKKLTSTKKNASIFSLFDKEHQWEDKDGVLQAVYWYRQLLALIMGLIWGVIGITGFVGIISFGILNSLAAYSLAMRSGYEFEADENFLSVKEGIMATLATFLVSWTVTYTAVHFQSI